VAHLEDELTGLSSPSDLTLNGYLESRSIVWGAGRRVVRMSLLVPTGAGDKSYEIFAYDEPAEFCLASLPGDLVRVRVRQPTESELNEGVEHTGLVVVEIGPFFLAHEEDEQDGEEETELG